MSKIITIAGILLFASILALATGYSAQAYTEQERLTQRHTEATKSLLATYQNLLVITQQKLYLLERLNGDTRKFHVMVAIAEAESNFNQKAYNAKSKDSGLFQINAASWDKTAKKMGLDYRGNWKDNIDMALYILDVQGLSAWNASKHNWSKKLSKL